MTDTQRAAMQQALEALIQADSRDGMYSYADEIAALSQALAAPQPAKCWKCGDTDPALLAVCDVPAREMRKALAEHDDSLTAVYMVGRYKAKKAEHQIIN